MEHIKVIDGEKKQSRDRRCTASTFLFYMCGVFGLLRYISSFSGIRFDWRILSVFVLVFGLLLWFAFSRGRKCFFFFFLLFAAACAVVVFKYRQSLFGQAEYFAAVIYDRFCGNGQTGPVSSVTGILVAAMSVVMYVMFIFEFITGNHGLLCLVFLGLLFLAPLGGLQTDEKTLLLLVVYMASFWVFQSARYRKKSLLHVEHALISERSGLICGILVMVIFLAVLPVVSRFSDRLYAGVYEAERLVYRTVDRLQSSRSESRTDGQVSRANQYKTGKEMLHLELTYFNFDDTIDAENKPGSPIYLKGFAGGAYTENGWERADDETLLKRYWANLSLQKKQDSRYKVLKKQRGKMAEYLEEAYYDAGITTLINQGFQDSEWFVVTTEYVTGKDAVQYHFEPYNHGQILQKDFQESPEGEHDVQSETYDFYDQKDLHIDWDQKFDESQISRQTQKQFEQYQEQIREADMPAEDGYSDTSEDEIWKEMYERNREAAANWNDQLVRLKNMQEVYLEAVTADYTKVPKERLPRLAELVSAHPLETVEEITAFIIETLRSNAAYSLTPGLSALNEDVVENFLFEKGSGYCVHFASAATLMYRLYGIPARYVSGYAVLPEDLEEVGSEPDDMGGRQYEAVLTDESAHAWVEIFMDGKGWTPVEVTPGGGHEDGSGSSLFPKEQLAEALENMDIPKTNEKAKEAPETVVSPDNDRPDPTSTAQEQEKEQPHRIEALLSRIAAPLGILLGVAVFLFLIGRFRRFRLRSMKKWDCRRVFGKMMRMLHFCGLFREWDGSEEEFPERLSRYASFLPEEDVQRMFEIVGQAAFGRGKPSGEETAFVRALYFKIADHACGDLNLPRKLIFRYGKAFG